MTPEQQKDLEIGQLAVDLHETMRNLVTRDGSVLYAEELYRRGVRSKLSEPLKHCPECERSFAALDDGRIPFHKVAFMSDWTECQGSRRLVEQSPSSEVTFRRAETLPEAVQRVIRFVAAYNHVYVPAPVLIQLPEAELSLRDLEATLAEIPDVAPRYPTIWAYEQACRTIRERDQRIEKAIRILSSAPIGTQDEVTDMIDAARIALRLRMPRVEPATEEQLSEVTRALEIADAQDEHMVTIPNRDWISATRALAGEVRHLRTLGDTLAADADRLLKNDVTSVMVVRDENGEFVPCGICSVLTPPRTTFAVGRNERGWPRCATHLVDDALADAGVEQGIKRCESCHHLSSSHFEDGTGCSVTVRDVGPGADDNCPCTFDARGADHGPAKRSAE